jgi:PhoH-like ATPase
LAKAKSGSTKSFVIDTNVLLHDPEAVTKFPNSTVTIPMAVLEELDSKKKFHDDLGRNARAAIRLLDSLKTMGRGDLHQGVEITNGSKIRIQLAIKTDLQDGLALTMADNRIIMAAYLLKDEGHHVIFVSKDLAARVKAEAVGIESEDYENLKVSYDEIYRGMRKVQVTKKDIDLFYKDGTLALGQWKETDLAPNEYCLLNSEEGTNGLGKYNPQHQRIEPIAGLTKDIWGIRPLNVEQRCTIDLLLRDDIKLVTLIGKAGTGKTLLALACGLRKVFDEGYYRRMLISRPIMPLGKDIGYLPGTKEEKLYHWMQPIYDNLEYLCNSAGGEPNDALRWIIDSKKMELEAVTYIRGRTLPKIYMIIDEAQNLTPHEVKTIISRAGEGTKVVLTGDPTQIDNPYLDKDSNGLTFTVEKFRHQKLFGHMFLEKSERSDLAALAAELM